MKPKTRIQRLTANDGWILEFDWNEALLQFPFSGLSRYGFNLGSQVSIHESSSSAIKVQTNLYQYFPLSGFIYVSRTKLWCLSNSNKPVTLISHFVLVYVTAFLTQPVKFVKAS